MVKNLYFPGGGGDQNRAKNATPEMVSLGLPPVGQISVSAALNTKFKVDQVFNGVLLNIKFRVKDRKILRRKIILIDLKTNFTFCVEELLNMELLLM